MVVESAVAISVEQPVTVGVPLPRGVLTDDRVLSLYDACGHRVPLQTTSLAQWPDQSVKWLLLDFMCGPVVGGQSTWSLDLQSGELLECHESATRIHLEETERGIGIDTGSATFTIDREFLAPIVQVAMDGMPILDAARMRTVLVDAKGRSRRPRIERSEIETHGPVRATVRFEGRFEGRRRARCRFRARLSFFAGSSLVRVELTIHNSRRARHRGGLWDLGDAGSIFFRDLVAGLGLCQPGLRQVRWTEEVAGPCAVDRGGDVRNLSRLQRR